MADVPSAGCEAVLDFGDGHPVSAVELAPADVEGACDRLRAAFEHTRYWPVAVVGCGSTADLWGSESFTDRSVVGQAAIDASADPELDLDVALRQLHGVDHDETAGYTARDLQPGPAAMAIEGVPQPPYQGGVLLVPADVPWEVLARIGFGDFNLCAGPTLHTCFLRYLWTEFRGVVRAVAGDVLVLELGSPAATREEALRLADRLYWYCSDLADAPFDADDPVAAVAARLFGGARRIVLWWD
jgi:hypothetical protein